MNGPLVIGLAENDSKATYFHVSASGRRALTAAGAPADKVAKRKPVSAKLVV